MSKKKSNEQTSASKLARKRNLLSNQRLSVSVRLSQLHQGLAFSSLKDRYRSLLAKKFNDCAPSAPLLPKKERNSRRQGKKTEETAEAWENVFRELKLKTTQFRRPLKLLRSVRNWTQVAQAEDITWEKTQSESPWIRTLSMKKLFNRPQPVKIHTRFEIIWTKPMTLDNLLMQARSLKLRLSRVGLFKETFYLV